MIQNKIQALTRAIHENLVEKININAFENCFVNGERFIVKEEIIQREHRHLTDQYEQVIVVSVIV
jgi:hypothetical protein